MSIVQWIKKRLYGFLHYPREAVLASLGIQTTAECGHKTKWRGIVGPYDDRREINLHSEKNGKPDYCLKCIENTTIRCAWCNEIILPNDPITLYGAENDGGFVPKKWVQIYNNDGKSTTYVGCLRWDCAETGADRAGFWRMPGKVERHPTPIEECLNSGEMVIVENLSKP